MRSLLAALLALSGCGYSVAAQRGQRVQVGAVRNDTAQVEAGGLFAQALREELQARGRLASDGPTMEGELLSLRSAPSALGGQGVAAFRLDADLRIRVVAPGGAVAYEDRAALGEDYLAGVDVLGTEANRRAALRRLLRAASREMVERMEIAATWR
jgi:outer membrane lipopolysaccharide assembly protein LptE/RlpB